MSVFYSLYMSTGSALAASRRAILRMSLLSSGIFAFLSMQAQGGYRITARFGSNYRLQSADVWNIDLQYAGTAAVNAYLQASIADVRGRKLVQLTTETVQIQPGINTFLSATTNTRQLEYFLQGLAELEQASGSLPSGTYTICYQAFCSTPDCDGAGQAALYNEFPECVQVAVEPPTPLLLSWPEDGAEIDLRRPAFSWIPPMPLAQVPGFSYTYTLYQAQKGQTCNEAALMNPPMYRTGGAEQPTMPYPPELDDLDTGKNYCWKVDGMLSDVQVAQSEVWRLKVRLRDTVKRNKVVIMPELTPSTEPYSVNANDTLVLVFNEEYQSAGTSWSVVLKPEGRNTESDLAEIVITPRFNGSGNVYFLPAAYLSVKPDMYYMLTAQNSRKDLFRARIVFK